MDEKRQRQPDEIFCSTCGEPIKKEAVICVHCGVQVQDFAPVLSRRQQRDATPRPVEGSNPKSKAASVLLAIFLGPWTWVYTYRRDGWKFWLSVCAGVCFHLGAASTAIGFFGIEDIVRFTMRSVWSLGALALIHFGFWLWGVILAASRSQRFYQDYPNG